MARMVATTIYMRPDQEQALKDLSAHTKVPMAVCIRQGIDAVLQRHGAADQAPPVAVATDGGEPR